MSLCTLKSFEALTNTSYSNFKAEKLTGLGLLLAQELRLYNIWVYRVADTVPVSHSDREGAV